MKKINKQVAKSKISYFLEINQVVVFFHCKNSVPLNKNDDFINLNKVKGNKSTLPSKTYREGATSTNHALSKNALTFDTKVQEQDLTCAEELFNNKNTFKSIMVKNRLAKKVFLELNQRKPLCYLNGNMVIKKQECPLNSLFQGPTLLLGCSDVEMLETGVRAFALDKSLILLGALYDKFIISHSQIKRLIAHSNKNQGYVNLVHSMRNPFLRPLFLIQTLLTLPCFLAKQKKLIVLLKARKQQMLVGN